MALEKITNQRIKKYEKEERITYTTILHRSREKLGISMTEYSIADLIHKLGGGETSRKMGGWVYASKEKMGRSLGVSRITIIRACNKLIKLNLIEKQEKTSYLRTTNLWYSSVVLEKEKLQRG